MAGELSRCSKVVIGGVGFLCVAMTITSVTIGALQIINPSIFSFWPKSWTKVIKPLTILSLVKDGFLVTAVGALAIAALIKRGR